MIVVVVGVGALGVTACYGLFHSSVVPVFTVSPSSFFRHSHLLSKRCLFCKGKTYLSRETVIVQRILPFEVSFEGCVHSALAG